MTGPVHDPLTERLLGLCAALRSAGVPTPLSEVLDGVRVIRHVDLLDRAMLREALAATIVTRRSDRVVFDDLFDLWFPPRPAAPETEGADVSGEAVDADDLVHRLVDALMGGDEAVVRALARAAVAAFGRADGRDGRPAWFQYRVLRAVDLQAVMARLLGEPNGDADASPFQRRLWRDEFEARLRWFREEVDAEIRRRTADEIGPDRVAQRLVRPPIDQVEFLRLGPADRDRLRAEVRPLARRLATRLAVRRRRGRTGRLDIRRTVRASLSTGGVPFDPVFRPRTPHRPELFVVCDVSGSVAAFSRFTLLLVHTIQEQFRQVRSFAFIDTLDEVTALFDTRDVDQAVRRIATEADLVWLDGHSDYGHSFARFHERYARDVTKRTTVLVLGDARTNYRRTNSWVLEDVRSRARRLLWLNPEPVRYWDTGDSVASDYARYVDRMAEVRNLEQLAGFVEDLA